MNLKFILWIGVLVLMGLNSYAFNESANYTTDMPTEWSTNFGINTISGILLLLFYLALVLVFFFLGFILKLPLFIILSSFMFLFLGFIVALKISILFGILCICVGLITAISGALML